MTSNTRFNVMIALAWSIAGALATAAVLPYAFDLLPGVLAKIKLPLPVVVLAQAVQGGAFLFALSFAGLSCSPVTGFDSPVVRGWFQGLPPLPLWRRRFLLAAALGVLAGGLLLVLATASENFLPAPRTVLPKIVLWKRLLASLYGGVTEECIVHLFLMSVLTWLLLKLLPATGATAHRWIVWFALGLAALLFALGHLPAVASLWPLTPMVVFRTVGLNGLGGALFGWLYWRWGFEFAVVAHLCADLMLHGLGS